MLARLAATAAAVAMVVGAVAVRERIDERDQRRRTTLRLVCSTELAGACEALARASSTRIVVTVEKAAATADRLTAAGPGRAPGLDGWLTTGPWPAMVADARRRAGLEPQLATGAVLARSPVVLAVWPDRSAALAPRCPTGQPGWRCLGEVAGQPWGSLGGQPTWGPVKPGHADPATAAGLTVLGAATAAWFGRVDLSRADLDDDAWHEWLSRLVRAAPSRPPSALEAMLTRGPSAFDAVGTLEAEGGPLLARSARPDRPTLLYPSPVATADVVLGSAAGAKARLLADAVQGGAGRRALAAAGWRVDGQPRARGVAAAPALPRGDGLPPAGVLSALREVVGEVDR